MRTEDDIAGFLRSLGLSDERYDSEGVFIETLKYADRYRLVEYGLLAGYGDAFAYRGRGIVVVGHSSVGKSTLARMFSKEHGSPILSGNDLLLFDAGSGQLDTYREPALDADTWDEAVRAYAAYLASTNGYPLGVVLYLNSDTRHQEGLKKPNTRKMLEYLTTPRRLADCPRVRDVPFLEYAKPHGYRDDVHVWNVFSGIRSEFDRVL